MSIAKYLLIRVLLASMTLFISLAIIFFLIRLIPGDPAQIMLGNIDDPVALERMRAALALDQPVIMQFLNWLHRLVQGDLGVSITQDRSVLSIIIPSFGVTASLVIPAVIIAALIAIPAGSVAAWKQNTKIDVIVMTAATIALSIPSFWLGLLFLLFFGLKLEFLPVVGYVSMFDNFWEGVTYLIMPVSALALTEAGVIVRLMRSSTIDVLRLEYITHAYAKGLTNWTVRTRHALPNAIAPTWTMIGLILGALLGGAVVTETVFTLPGLGRLLVESIFARDYPVIQGCMLIVTLSYVCVNVIVDTTYLLLSPGASYD
ncbi:ABC transporter permease [Kordiimonas pumila]|uniref:ABC transporter permease n=1 Tax=Kordiimonas pumila TaxID=2161677 RepID=A0ABV7D4T0_9PROT|nr:ABC transporter permease [Kordiimonas pumila]